MRRATPGAAPSRGSGPEPGILVLWLVVMHARDGVPPRVRPDARPVLRRHVGPLLVGKASSRSQKPARAAIPLPGCVNHRFVRI